MPVFYLIIFRSEVKQYASSDDKAFQCADYNALVGEASKLVPAADCATTGELRVVISFALLRFDVYRITL